MSGVSEADRQKCVNVAMKVAIVTTYGKVQIETLPSDPEGKNTQPGQTPHHTLAWDVPPQHGVINRQSCRIDKTNADEFVNAVDGELFRMMHTIAVMRVLMS